MQLDKVFEIAVRIKASDIFVKVDSPVKFRRLGLLVSVRDSAPITPNIVDAWINKNLPEYLRENYEEKGDIDFGYESGVGIRFRVNVFRQNGYQSFVARVLHNYVRSIDELELPESLHQIPKFKGGLVFITGTVGSGKSTTLAAIVQQMNLEYPYHIVTIEDPIEYLFQDQKSLINQRELAIDTVSYSQAIKGSLRQNPDVVVLGELRDKETALDAMIAAETGILILTTMHTHNTVESLSRFLSFFPAADQSMVKSFLARTLRMSVSQRLVHSKDRKAMHAATEIMLSNKRIAEIIRLENNFHTIHDIIKESNDYYGMHSFDQSLAKLYEVGKISRQTALNAATNRADLKIALSGIRN